MNPSSPPAFTTNPSGLSALPPNLSGMKTAFGILVLIIAVLASGCTAPAPQAAPAPTPAAEPVIPTLSGTWTGTMQGYNEKIGFTDYGGKTMSLVITGQQGRIFSGHLLITLSNTTRSSAIAGVISRDGTTFSMVESDNGYSTGRFIGTDEMELTWMNDGNPIGAAIDTLKRE